MSITRNFKLFLNAGRTIPLVINVNQYDHNETWIFTLYDETGQKYSPTTGSIVGIKSDGYTIADAGTVNAAGQVVITETEQMTAAVGKAVFELLIDSQTHGTANFVVLVEPSPTTGGVVSDSDLSLIQQALDSTNPEAIAQGVSDWMDDNLAPEEWVIDSSLSVAGAAADAKKTGDEISALNSAISQMSGLSAELKLALDNFASVVAYAVSDGASYYNALHDALYPPVGLVSISAEYTQSGTVSPDDSLDSLKSDLVVTAHYDDSSSEVLPDNSYTLSGTLTVGTSTITVSYGGKTTTFTVTVTGAYTEITAIIATNTNSSAAAQYIKTDVVPELDGSTYTLETSIKWSTTQPGGNESMGSTQFQVFRQQSAKYTVNGTTTNIACDTSDYQDIVFTQVAQSNGAWTIDIGGSTASGTRSTIAASYPYELFAVRSTNNVDGFSCFNGAMKYFKLSKGSTVLLDMVAAIRNSDNKPGMYDRQNDVFYPSSGSGDFTYEA